MLASLLIASATHIITELVSSIDYFLDLAQVPHFMQMHKGELDQGEIDVFVKEHDSIVDQQTVAMLNINGSNLYLGGDTSEADSVMDISFVTQNDRFDYLLDLENKPISLEKGQVGVPIYFMKKNSMEIGDKVRIVSGNETIELVVASFVRDAQMNSPLATSKRFVVSKDDYDKIVPIGDMEYLIEFHLKDMSLIPDITKAYEESNLPKKGPAIDYNLFKSLNAISDGIVALVIILISLLLMMISILCLRFTMISTMEEDYREIAVMKAIGIQGKHIRNLYMIKYIAMVTVAAILGYAGSFFLGKIVTAGIALNMGTTPKTTLDYMMPLIATGIVFIIIIVSCMIILRRFKKITPVDGLRATNIRESRGMIKLLSLYKNRLMNTNIFLGVKDVIGQLRVYSILLVVFIICTFILIIPVNIYNTIKSPTFVTYMGIGKSDMRIDIQQSKDITERYDAIHDYIKADKDVDKYGGLITCRYKVLNSENIWQNMSIETGDLSVFPLNYMKGRTPTEPGEIALSVLGAKELNKNIGDTLNVQIEGQSQPLTVTGIYQDVTNGGKTAKALIPYTKDTVLWYVMGVNLKQGVDITKKMEEYAGAFDYVKISNLDSYVTQTFDDLIKQLRAMKYLAIAIAIAISCLITSLFLKMLMAKDSVKIAIMKSLGFSSKNIQVQYVTRGLLVLVMGIILGTIVSNTLGQSLVSLIASSQGASAIMFIINPIETYFLYPLLLTGVVVITTIISSQTIETSSIAEKIRE